MPGHSPRTAPAPAGAWPKNSPARPLDRVPRRAAETDPAAGRPLPFDALDPGRQDEEQMHSDARALRRLLADASGRSGVRR